MARAWPSDIRSRPRARASWRRWPSSCPNHPPPGVASSRCAPRAAWAWSPSSRRPDRKDESRPFPLVSFETKLRARWFMKHYIHFPKVEGQASRQAHADLPEGTYEREISKEGFFGPAAHLYHRHPPTGWVNFEGPLRPHAFDCTKLPGTQGSPWSAPELLHNSATRVRFWNCDGQMPALAS